MKEFFEHENLYRRERRKMLNLQKFFKIQLPKWSGLLVKGKKVTIEQAKEICIRTNSRWMSSNHRIKNIEFINALYGVNLKPNENKNDLLDAFRLEKTGNHLEYDWEAYDNCIADAEDKYGLLNLDYLENSRVSSCWVSGHHGWCNWDGIIFTREYNIGKRPSVESVYDEWKEIAIAFPYLNLRAQLLDKEIGENDAKPVVEYIVKNGKVKMVVPKALLLEPEPSNLFDRSEIGVSLDYFKDALKYCENIKGIKNEF